MGFVESDGEWMDSWPCASEQVIGFILARVAVESKRDEQRDAVCRFFVSAIVLSLSS